MYADWNSSIGRQMSAQFVGKFKVDAWNEEDIIHKSLGPNHIFTTGQLAIVIECKCSPPGLSGEVLNDALVQAQLVG